MGFIQQKFADNQGGLMVAFQDTESNQFYYAGDSVEDALKHFDMYIKDNIIYIKTDEEKALETIGVKTAQEATELRETINTIVDDYTDEQMRNGLYLMETTSSIWAQIYPLMNLPYLFQDVDFLISNLNEPICMAIE